MKLAEALIHRADSQKRIQKLKYRLLINAKVQEGEEPSENPQALIAELNATINELANLIKRINRTNSLTILQEQMSISDAIAERDTILLKRSVYNDLIDAASQKESRYSRSEIKIFSTVNVPELQAQMDQMSRYCRELDTSIQQANWNTELVD